MSVASYGQCAHTHDLPKDRFYDANWTAFVTYEDPHDLTEHHASEYMICKWVIVMSHIREYRARLRNKGHEVASFFPLAGNALGNVAIATAAIKKR